MERPRRETNIFPTPPLLPLCVLPLPATVVSEKPVSENRLIASWGVLSGVLPGALGKIHCGTTRSVTLRACRR